jgi:hypothetical protein
MHIATGEAMKSKEKDARNIVSLTRNRSVPLALMLLLTACASPGELRQGRPDLDETTNIPAERVAGCIGDKVDASGLSAALNFATRPTTNGYSISGSKAGPWGGTDTNVLVDIKSADKTQVQLFTHGLLFGSDPWVSLVKGCL